MKNTVITLLVAILVVAIVNLLAALGLIGGGTEAASGANYEYKVMNAQQMDALGFRAVAEEEGIEISEEGEINFPKEMVDKIAKINMLPRTIHEVEKEGSWSFVTVTGDNHYIFRRSK